MNAVRTAAQGFSNKVTPRGSRETTPISAGAFTAADVLQAGLAGSATNLSGSGGASPEVASTSHPTSSIGPNVIMATG